MSIKIERASISNSEIMSEIHYYSWKSTYKGMIPDEYLMNLKPTHWVSMLKNGFSENNLVGWVAYLDEMPIGCACVGNSRYAGYENDLELISIYTLPEYFGIGVGKLLMDEVKKYANENGYLTIGLWVLDKNISATIFYEKMGFFFNNDTMKIKIGGSELTEYRYVFDITNVCGI